MFWGIFGKKNTRFTSKRKIQKQLNEPRPLPMGRQEFEDWSDRIIAGAMIPGATVETQKATLAGMILHLGPQEDHKPDNFFIHGLRKLAANQVGNEMFIEIRDRVKNRLKEDEEKAKLKIVECTNPSPNETQILANKTV